MTAPLADTDLWQNYRTGDKEALGQLAERYYRMLRHYGLKFMLSDDAVDDCLQELFLQLWQNRATIGEAVSVKHYLLKALRNHVVQHVRDQKRLTYDELDWDTSLAPEADSESLLIRQESLDLLTKTIQNQVQSLPAREREVLYLRYYESLTIPEIAEVMHVNKQSVSNLLQKALSKLRKNWHNLTPLTIWIFFEKFFL